MSLCVFHLGRTISPVLGYIDHAGRHGICAKTRIRGKKILK
jgi:hypothetical protein